MNVTSERLKSARKEANLTFRELSSYSGISEKSLMRYESGKSTPDAYNLKALAAVYSISVDYLLGISNDPRCDLTGEHGLRWYQYQRTLNNKIRGDTEYYWLIFDPNIEDLPMKGAMEWCGNDDNRELYRLRPVKPKECINLIHHIYKTSPLIINSDADWHTLLLYGVHAITAEDICYKYVPYLMRPDTVVNT